MTLNKYLLTTFTILTAGFAIAQSNDGFDFNAAYQDAYQKGIAPSEIEGYVKYLHYDYLSHRNLGNINANRPSSPIPNTPQNAYCPNAGFEQLTFVNWTGGYGTVSPGAVGAPFPIYNQTSSSIVNSAGNNTSLVNTINYHTIMTTPATNSVYPNCVGYDTIACKVIGTQTVSEIPVVNPNGGPASVRLNGALANLRASKLNYFMSLNPNNKNFSVSYALVLENGGHFSNEQPYFSVKITDQNGILVPGCSTYTVTCDAGLTNTASPLYDPTWANSAIQYDVMYRKWQTFAFDFSNYPSITSVNVEFYVGGCSGSAHYGYAYVDASCSQGGAVTSFCAGSNSAVINAPFGYSTYQWTGPSGPVSLSNGGSTASATITPVTAGQVFTCAVTAPNGCSSIFTTTVSITTVSITSVGSTPSCPGGNSGTANVTATGSSLGYSYQWLNSVGSTVGTTQSVTGLSPGTYTVNVNSAGCGSATSTIVVGISPPNFYSLSAPFCGTVAWITKSGGSNYKWYTASPLAAIPGATTQSLTINSPVAGDQYYLSYTTASGCKDSIKYTLTQVPGGNVYVSNIRSICPGNSNSYAVVNLQTSSPPVYSYTVTGPAGYSSVLNNTTAIKDSVINLTIGTYSTTVFDGQCLYNTTFTVNPFVYTYTLTPTTTTICTSGGTSLTVNFGNNLSATCGLDPVVCLTGSPTNLYSGPFTQNGTTSYPTPYGNWYTYERSQYLIKASDLNAAGINAGKLSSLAFNVLSMNTSITTYPNFSIKMGCTGLASLPNVSGGSGQAFVGGLQTVYSNANQPVALGWNTHNFSQAYVWDGTSNLLVEVCFGMNNPYSYTQNVTVELKQLPYIASTFHAEDTNPVCGGTQLADNSYGLMTSGEYMVPNMKLGYCGGQNPSNFTYTWTPTAGLSSTNTYSTLANPTATTIYTVQVNPIGQTNCMQAQTSTITVVNPASPTITSVAPLCTNAGVITLTATPTGGSWLGSGVSAAGVLTPSLVTAGNNTYTYTVGSGTCSAIGNTTISVQQFIPSTITSAISPQCNTNPPLPLPATTSSTGTWTATGGLSGTNFNPSVGPGTYTLTYSTQSTPITSLCPSSSSIAVNVSSITQPTVSAAGPYCDNFATQTMTVNPVGGGTGVWGTSTAGSAITPAGIFSPASSIVGANTITYTLTNGPCTASTSINIQVVHFISAALTGGTGPFCIYSAATDLQTLAQNAGGVWSGSGVAGTNFTPATAGVGTHIVTYSVNPAPAGLCPDHTDLSIVVSNTTLVVPLTYSYVVCNYPTQVSFYNTSVNTDILSWDFGDNSTDETGFAPVHTYTSPGSYTVTTTYTNSAGCVSSAVMTTAITVYPVPVAAFNASPDVTTVVDGEVTFTNQTSDLNNNTYAWLFTGADGSSAINPTYLFTNSGEYPVRLIAISSFGCRDTAVVKVTVNPDVVLYVPNTFTPNGDGLNDEFQIFLPPTGVDYSTFSLTVYDRWGSVIYRTNDVFKFWNGARNNSGEVVKQDSYVYKISFKDEKKKYYEKVGYITILSGK